MFPPSIFLPPSKKRMCNVTKINEVEGIRLIHKISSLYYSKGFSQQEISERLKISRPRISRLLKKARELGIVQIIVNIPDDHHVDLETKLEKKFNLREVIIVETSVSESIHENDIKNSLGFAASKYLERTISDGDIIGMSWGTTLKSMIENVSYISTNDVHVVQTLGGVGPADARDHAMDISRRLSIQLDARLTLLQIPGIVSSPEIKKILLTDHRLQANFELFSKINKVFVGIGSLKTNPILNRENKEIPNAILKDILHSKAVGDIGLNFYDINGMEVDTGFKDLFIGMTLEDFKHVDNVVGVAGGVAKFEAILGAVTGGFLDVLITDHATAVKLLRDRKQ